MRAIPPSSQEISALTTAPSPSIISPAFWAGRTVLVTGAAGFVGSWLVLRLLELGAIVVVLLRKSVSGSWLDRSGALGRVVQIHSNLADYGTLVENIRAHQIDTIFHLGAQSLVKPALQDPLQTFETNIRGTYTLLEAARQAKGVSRIVMASTEEVYQKQEGHASREAEPLTGSLPYDVSKVCADLLAFSYHATFGLPVAVLRCGHIYGGADMNLSRIVPGTILAVLAGNRPVIHSDGSARRDFIYVGDVVHAYLTLAQALDLPLVAGQAYNFGLEQPVSILELVRTILQVMDRPDLQPQVLGKDKPPAGIHLHYLSCARVRAELGWTPQYSLVEGLAQTIDWYKHNG
ncbi:MAG: GDP-mannose 4,6-dehydratase [Chloroflexi bacterium]|nr:GDP-mannose 4,6-dehydratase [Chloroflexota bacterium]